MSSASQTTSQEFSIGFEPLIVTEEESESSQGREMNGPSENRGGDCEDNDETSDTDEEEESTTGGGDGSESGSESESENEEQTTLTNPVAQEFNNAKPKCPHVLQKMPSFDFNKKITISSEQKASMASEQSQSAQKPRQQAEVKSSGYCCGGGLPPIPPIASESAQKSTSANNHNHRPSSSSRHEQSPGPPGPSAGGGPKKRISRRYASSLPDRRSHSPTYDLSLLLAAEAAAAASENCPTHLHSSSSGIGCSGGGGGSNGSRPSKQHYKNKYFYGRASAERETKPKASSRHSSYHPADEAALAAAVAYKYNQMFFSRPTSPLFFDHSDLGGCCSRTLPRASCSCCCSRRGSGTGLSTGSLLGLDYEDRLLRLESDKESLHLQVSCLSDQIDAQTSKIHDLEKLLDDKRNVLESTEDSLQRELLTRSSLETQKLELLTEISSLRLKHASLERENFELKDRIVGGSGRIWDKPPLSSPSQNNIVDSTTSWQITSRTLDGGSPHKIQRPKTPPASAYRRVEQSAFGTIPRRSQVSTDVLNKNASFGNIHAITNGNGSKPNTSVPISYQLQLKPLHCSESFRQPVGGYYPSGGGSVGLYLASETGNRSTSAPNLAAIEREEWERRNSASKKSPGAHKSRGILRILGKLKRSNSGGLDNEVSPEGSAFVRGGFRSTANPRLGWMKEPLVQKPDGPITSWDSNNVILWLNYLGLAMYSNEVKRWVKTGQQLLDASSQELEKELGIKNALHRKKLNLALYCLKHPEEEDNAGKLDYHWVIRWLDDVGLPQYKETFADARVDGRVLSHLTAEDLFALKVTSLLHHSSLKRGIQLLRIHKFHPGCLCRRGAAPFEDEGPKSVATWTNHRVMEWLKVIDLAEYAPNLRGSGVHGALIIFEPKFNAELLSTLLSIPGNKTLLRRHLSLQVNELVGRYIVQEKRVVELSPDFVPINPTVKVKPPKSSKVFRLKSKRLSTDAPEELLCPMEWNTYPSPDGLITSMENFDGAAINGGEKVSNI